MNFADKLNKAIESKQSCAVVGLDPDLAKIPADQRGLAKSPVEAAKVYLDFCRRVIDAVADLVPAVKPQIAFFEACGVAGYDAYLQTVAHARKAGLLVIGDIKRGDIASTGAAYAQGHLSSAHSFPTPDAVTLNPYLGGDSIDPFLKICAVENKGLFILAKTSNPGSGDFQNLKLEGGEFLYERVSRRIGEWGKALTGQSGFSSVGAVVGATWPEELARVRGILPSTIFLIPGYGAQGGGADELKAAWNARGFGAVVNSSRGIIYAGGDAKGESWTNAIRDSARRMNDDINRVRFSN